MNKHNRKLPSINNNSFPKSHGFCIVNGRLVFDFWRSLDPWKEAQDDAEIECEYCHKRVLAEDIHLDTELKKWKSANHSCRESLAKFICTDCKKVNDGKAE